MVTSEKIDKNISAIKLEGVEVRVEKAKDADYVVIDESQKEIIDGNVYLVSEKDRFSVTDEINSDSKIIGRVIQVNSRTKSL